MSDPDPCHCATADEAKACRRAGVEMRGRLYDLCRGHNCTEKASREYRAAWDAQALPTVAAKVSLPCVYLGADTGELRPCPPPSACKAKVFACAHPIHGPTTTLRDCAGCAGNTPDTYRLIAPVGTAERRPCWQGRLPRPPWSYRVSAAIPHLNTLDTLPVVVELLRLQTERPYILVIDTGSPPAVCAELEKMRAEDLEVHFIRGHGYIHSSEPVTVAMDTAFARCQTRYLFATHADCFPRRRDLLAWLLGQCDETTPVVGWQMSPRDASPLWEKCVSHTATMFEMRTMRRHGVNWNLTAYYEAVGVPAKETVGWPDTESQLHLCLERAGIKPKLLGPEPNFQRHITDWFDHARSVTGTRAHLAGSDLHKAAERYTAEALADARQRLREWGG